MMIIISATGITTRIMGWRARADSRPVGAQGPGPKTRAPKWPGPRRGPIELGATRLGGARGAFVGAGGPRVGTVAVGGRRRRQAESGQSADFGRAPTHTQQCDVLFAPLPRGQTPAKDK